MKTILIIMGLLAVASVAAAYTPEQQAMVDGVRLSFQLGQSFERASSGGDISGFNSLVDQWNAWVLENLGNDTDLLMVKMTLPVDQQKPYSAALNNTTSKGIAHEMDGRSQYTSNDINTMPDAAISRYASSDAGQTSGAEFLGGV